MGELFDAPDALECYRRSRSIVPQQALALTNSELAHQVSSAITVSIAEPLAERFIFTAFERILSRPPTATETAACLLFLSDSAGGGKKESLVRALLNHNDFVTIR